MKRLGVFGLSILWFFLANGQDLKQTVRGQVIDQDSRLPLPGVTIYQLESSEPHGTITDPNGNFKLEDVPVGRITLQFSSIGYTTQIQPNLLINSAQQVVLNIELQPAVISVDEVTVNASRDNGGTLNDMAMNSVHSISPELTQRYSSGHDDPSHILTSFAGIASSQSGNNDIIVRGNSPKYVQWRLEGTEITTPYHQSDQNSTTQGFCLINNKLLSLTDFYTGAFAPEYGNALSGIYDVKLRSGNNEKFEASTSVGLMGTDLILEGPLKKGYSGSYLLNYRYSTIGLLTDLNLVTVDGITTAFQDATFKMVLPTKKAGLFSFFGLGGLDNLSVEDVQPNIWITPGNDDMESDMVEDFEQDNYLGNLGMNHSFSINSKSYIKTTFSYFIRSITENVFESNDESLASSDLSNRIQNYKSRYYTSVASAKTVYNNKINPKNKFRVGIEYSAHNYDLNQSQLDSDKISRITLTNHDGNMNTFQSFISWKHFINNQLSIVCGLHNMNVLLTNESTIEPRASVKWIVNDRNSLHAAYGNHSNLERIHNYYTCIEQSDGSLTYPNMDLELLRAHHYILGYQHQLTDKISSKIEVYYQKLYNLPVENNENSYYCSINENSDYNYVELINKGTGKNYGIEITLERYFQNNYYFLLNGSLYDSKYTALDGIERNTRFNNNFLCNFLVGKEFELGQKHNKILSVDTKIFYYGGQRYIPLLRDANGNLAVDEENDLYYDYSKAYEQKFENLFELNLSVSFKINCPKVAHELFLEIGNVTNNQSRMSEYYDTSEPDNIGYIRQMQRLPNFMYRLYF